jgi:hypothetical protein
VGGGREAASVSRDPCLGIFWRGKGGGGGGAG